MYKDYHPASYLYTLTSISNVHLMTVSKKTEGKYKIPSASRMETIEEKFREKMKQLAAKQQEVDLGSDCHGLEKGDGRVEEMEYR